MRLSRGRECADRFPRALRLNRAPSRSQSFTYDELNRIKSAASQATTGSDAWGLAFGYDIWANLLSATVTQGFAPMLGVSVTTMNQMSGLCYDSAGNLVLNSACPEPPGTPFTPTYSYDAENRMTSTAGVTYTYDGDGRRVKKSNGKLYWYGTGSDPLEETNLSGTPTADFIFFNGKRISRLDLPGAAVHYYFSNHLGSASVVTDALGTMSVCPGTGGDPAATPPGWALRASRVTAKRWIPPPPSPPAS